MAVRRGYSALQMTLRWVIAILIGVAWYSGDGTARALRQRVTTGILGNTLHVRIGGAVFVLVLVRIIVRCIQGAQASEATAPAWQEMVATWAHRLLCVLMVLVPLAGAAAWYGHIAIAADLHPILANGLMVLALGHAAFAIWHHDVVKDVTLRRMSAQIADDKMPPCKARHPGSAVFINPDMVSASQHW